jgi:multiple sugar transport system substrate-binding protein
MIRWLLGCLIISSGLAQDFNWKTFEGQTLSLLLPQHPYQQVLVERLETFTDLTGITVAYDVFPLESYFDEAILDLSRGKSSRHDVLMTDVYHLWQFAPAGWLEKLEPYLSDASKTSSDYDFEDIFQGLRDSTKWNLEAGPSNLGQGSQYALPLAFEAGVMMYRKDLFETHGLSVPQTLDELIEVSTKLKEINPMAIPDLSWESFVSVFITLYTSYGCHDFDEAMLAQVNSSCAVEVTEKWLELVKQVDEQPTPDVALILGFSQPQLLDSFAWAVLPGQKTNVNIWSLAMNARSKHKDAAWLFLQWATGKDLLGELAIEHQIPAPVRASIWADDAFQQSLSESYLQTFQAITTSDMKVQFTPQALFFETIPDWAAALQDIYRGADIRKRLDELAASMNEKIKKAGAMR